MLDAGCLMLVSEYWFLDTRFWMLDTSCLILDARYPPKKMADVPLDC